MHFIVVCVSVCVNHSTTSRSWFFPSIRTRLIVRSGWQQEPFSAEQSGWPCKINLDIGLGVQARTAISVFICEHGSAELYFVISEIEAG